MTRTEQTNGNVSQDVKNWHIRHSQEHTIFPELQNFTPHDMLSEVLQQKIKMSTAHGMYLRHRS